MDIMHLLFSFQGRSRRLHYWMAAISAWVVYIVVVGILANVTGMAQHPGLSVGSILVLPFVVAYIWVSLALGVKRCHDRDKSGWWLLLFGLASLTVIGILWPFIELACLDGTPGPNRFGPSPKGLGEPTVAVPAA
jgi:uncharacterized membrane protein YhaH (DUF805 family)